MTAEHEQKYQENMAAVAKEISKHITPEIYAELAYILSLTPSDKDSEQEAARKRNSLLALKSKKDQERRAHLKAERQARLQARAEGNK